MNAADYQSFADTWENRATIRTRPRRMVENDDKLIYPLSRQPLVLSETFVRECPEQRDFALVQTLYKFINDVVIFETEIVDKTARSIAKNRFAVPFPFACRYDAMTVVVDEDYHALVAMGDVEPVERNKFQKSANEYYRRQMKIATYNSLVNPVTEVLGIIMVLIASLMGGYLVLGQHTHIFGIKISNPRSPTA